jgi:hypothetical protein
MFLVKFFCPVVVFLTRMLTNLPRALGDDAKRLEKKLVPAGRVLDHLHVVRRSLVVHAPAAVDKL